VAAEIAGCCFFFSSIFGGSYYGRGCGFTTGFSGSSEAFYLVFSIHSVINLLGIPGTVFLKLMVR